MTDRRSLADRLSGLTPHQVDQAGVTVVLCELIDELTIVMERQNMLLERQNVAIERQTVLLGERLTAPEPTGLDIKVTARADQEWNDMRLREPLLPPVDPDPEPASERGQDSGSTPAHADRKDGPAKKTTAAKAPRRRGQ